MSTRAETLDKANSIVNGARADQYGGPEDSFSRIASLWSSYLTSPELSFSFSSADVACMMALLKIARLRNSPDHEDSWVDLAGYAACGSEVSSMPEEVDFDFPTTLAGEEYDPVWEQKYKPQVNADGSYPRDGWVAHGWDEMPEEAFLGSKTRMDEYSWQGTK
jgi:hypothetical protein